MAKCGKVTNRACAGKVAWPNKRRCAVEARRRGTGLVAYLCAMCGWWHLGHLPRSGEPTWPDGWRPHQLTQRGGADCWCGAHHDTYGDVAHLNFATFNLDRLED